MALPGYNLNFAVVGKQKHKLEEGNSYDIKLSCEKLETQGILREYQAY